MAMLLAPPAPAAPKPPHVYSCMISYKDNNNRRRSLRVTASGPSQLARWVTKFRRMELKAAAKERRYRANVTTFTDLGAGPEGPPRARPKPPPRSMAGYPWEGPRFAFTLLLGEDASWAGPDSVRLWYLERGEWRCRFCGHLQGLGPETYCLGCDRSGRDLAIPRGRPRAERHAPPDGRLRGGCEGKR